MKITIDQINYMIQSYVINKKNTHQIAKELGISHPTVSKYLKKNGITISLHTYKFNERYFNNINTSNKAYFLGFIYADGCIMPKGNSCAIKLTKEDDYILEEFKRDIDSQKPLYYRKSEPIKGTKYIGKAQSKLELNSKILIEDLQNLGVIQNKSLTLEFPSNMPFMRDFIRGYFDGDGCIYKTQNRIMLNFAGSEYFCNGLCNFLKLNLNINVIPKKEKRGKSWYIFITRIKDVLKFCNYIYQDESCIKLNRKYQKFKEYDTIRKYRILCSS